jgi:catechol 2,3-dioxygenase-like lactoylglutathione lyase family enzyme
MPLAHVSLPVTDLQASKAFYLTALKPLGYEVFLELESTIGFGPKHDNPDFWLHKCPNEKASDAKTQKTHVAFRASSHSVVHAFHEIAL